LAYQVRFSGHPNFRFFDFGGLPSPNQMCYYRKFLVKVGFKVKKFDGGLYWTGGLREFRPWIFLVSPYFGWSIFFNSVKTKLSESRTIFNFTHTFFEKENLDSNINWHNSILQYRLPLQRLQLLILALIRRQLPRELLLQQPG
jgi:hypothetical protein